MTMSGSGPPACTPALKTSGDDEDDDDDDGPAEDMDAYIQSGMLEDEVSLLFHLFNLYTNLLI